jgi:GntR family transcriptional regulator / MocR family aminotransferase
VSSAIPLLKEGGPLFRQLYRNLREAILSGALRPGDRLPSTRDFAEQLGVSRTVVLWAYDQLLAEGFALGRGGSGTYVAAGLDRNVHKKQQPAAKLRLSCFGSTAAQVAATVDFPGRRSTAVRYDFAYARSYVEKFPFEMWRRILLRYSREAPVGNSSMARLRAHWRCAKPFPPMYGVRGLLFAMPRR